MPPKKADDSFIKQIGSSVEWQNSVVKNSGQLVVVDVYSSNWGPCDMLVGHFSNLYFELSEKLSFGFARAAADTVPVLKDLAGAAAPTFLFFLDGKEVARIVGPRMTEIKAKINELSPKL